MSSVRLDDGLDQREAEPEAARRTAGVGAIEPVPDERQVVGRDPDARVADGPP